MDEREQIPTRLPTHPVDDPPHLLVIVNQGDPTHPVDDPPHPLEKLVLHNYSVGTLAAHAAPTRFFSIKATQVGFSTELESV